MGLLWVTSFIPRESLKCLRSVIPQQFFDAIVMKLLLLFGPKEQCEIHKKEHAKYFGQNCLLKWTMQKKDP